MPSTIPAALAALTTVFTTAAVPGLTVSDGPQYDPAGPYCCVGWDGTEDTPGVTARAEPGDYGRRSDREQYEVACLLAWWVDDNNIAEARAALFTAFDTLVAALDADQTLGDVAVEAMVSDSNLLMDIGETGGAVELRFTVAVDAFKH